MKKFFLFIIITALSASVFAQQKSNPVNIPDTNKKIDTVETACGECQFKMTGKSCDLAVRINGKSYFVEGTDIDSHGDAHAKDGFCNSIRKAAVQGEVVDNKYKVTYFKLISPSASGKPSAD